MAILYVISSELPSNASTDSIREYCWNEVMVFQVLSSPPSSTGDAVWACESLFNKTEMLMDDKNVVHMVRVVASLG